jgi:hypothetical protein
MMGSPYSADFEMPEQAGLATRVEPFQRYFLKDRDMTREIRCLLLMTAACWMGLAIGCGTDESSPQENDNGAGAVKQSGAGIPQTADAAVMAVVQGLQQDNPRAVWDFLPESYQADVNSLVSEFANGMDAELWNGGFGLVTKLVTILKDKREFILSSDQLANAPVDAEALSQNWDTLLQLFTTLVESDLSDLEKLKTFDGGDYLSKTGAALMMQLAAASKLVPEDPYQIGFKDRLSNVAAKVVEMQGNVAILELTDPAGKVTKVDFVRVDDKWIPAAMKADWSTEMGRMRAAVKQMPQMLASVKPQMMNSVKMVDGILDQIAAAKSQEQFTQAVAAGVLPILMAAGPLMGGGDASGASTIDPRDFEAPPVDASASALPGVTVTVNKKLDDAAVDDVIGKLARITDDADNALAIPQDRSDESTSIGVAPVADLQEFVKRIKFAKVISVNKANASVVIELTE